MKMHSFPSRIQPTVSGRTRPGLRPSMGSEQPPPPWGGLLLDRTCPTPLEDAPLRKEMRGSEPEGRSVHRHALNRLFSKNAGKWQLRVSLRKEAGFSVGPRGGGMAQSPSGSTDAEPMNGADPNLLYGAYGSDDAE